MKFAKDTNGIERYIAIDIHKEYALVGGQNARQDWVMQPRREDRDREVWRVGRGKPPHWRCGRAGNNH